jgi:MFS family permease
VTAGIGILGMASPLLQEVFGGRLIGLDQPFDELDGRQLQEIAAIAAAFTGLLSLFNIAGRIFWASLSDRIGRKTTYAIFLLLGFALYAAVPWTAEVGSLALFVASFCIIVSMYGGGFAAIPAYLADLFGTKMVGAIHGRLLTAWSTAGVLGPALVNYIREYQLDHGVARADAYSATMYLLAGLLAVGFVCNWLVALPPALAAAGRAAPVATARRLPSVDSPPDRDRTRGASSPWMVGAAWLAVWTPIGWGVWTTLQKAVLLFR